MIVNMPVNGTGSASSPTSNPSNNNNNKSNATNQNNNNTTNNGDYNFLKRKYDDQEELALGQDYEPIEGNPWKKRHLDYDVAGDLQFHLQLEQNPGNSSSKPPAQSTTSFINDLFAYDSSLLVPAAAGYSHCPPSSAPLEDNGGWTGGELLELDHRYNSGLQAELGQLNATLPPPPSSQNNAQQNPQQNPNPGHSPNPNNPNFLVPQKQRILSAGRRTSSGSASGGNEVVEADFEDKNLSWLLNFKFDEFPHLSPHNQAHGHAVNLPEGSVPQTNPPNSTAISTSPCSSASPTSASVSAASATNSNHSLGSGMMDQRARSPKSSCSNGAMPTGGGGGGCSSGAPAPSGGSTKTGRKFEELVMEVTSELDGNDMIVAEHVVVEDTSSKAPKKPPFTYTELIEYALEDKGELTVSGIYQWISDRFPYYKSNDDRWKNSVRHNLSINPHFRKGVKAPQGAGHLWAISSGDSAENVLAWEHKKQRLDLFFKMESINRERIQQHQQQQQLQQQQQHQQQQQQQQQHSPQQHATLQATQQQHATQASSCLYDEAAVAAATLTQEMMSSGAGGGGSEASQQHHHNHQSHQNHHNHHHQRLLPFNDLLSDDELRKTAGQILNGIHREVEVQSVNSIISTYHDVLLDNDYLNPIHKDVVVTESVLRQQHGNLGGGSNNHLGGNGHMGGGSSQYYITEIDPMELGIQMSHQVEPSEEEVLFSDEFNLNYFGYNTGSDIVA
ncbi:alpha-protein kinase 1 [Drosophila rhopaloa]|uniref:Alpha-protein kinase 1 n=1 Tax=Drosophila rhopaloa TaxID=1041015 RepID=A0A6P4EY86_DRORH|nr:alpha-protein kinase 1 [Drosophila rhopaloa]